MSKQFIFKNQQSNKKPSGQAGSSTIVIDKEEIKRDQGASGSIEANPLAFTLI